MKKRLVEDSSGRKLVNKSNNPSLYFPLYNFWDFFSFSEEMFKFQITASNLWAPQNEVMFSDLVLLNIAKNFDSNRVSLTYDLAPN